MKKVRLSGYDDRETANMLAKADLSQIKNVALAQKDDLPEGEQLSYTDDHILCFVGKFDYGDTTYIIDILWDGEAAYAAFDYAEDSERAKKRAIYSIESWIGCAKDTGGFYDPKTGIISDGRGNVQLDENGVPNKVSGY
jgi:hypothetical protein